MSQILFYLGAFFLLVSFAIVGFEVFVGEGKWAYLFIAFYDSLLVSLSLFFLSYVLEGMDL